MGAPRRSALALFLGVLVVYLLTASYTTDVSVDVHASSAQAWGVGTSGSISLHEADPEQLLKINGDWNRFIVLMDDRLVAARTPGSWLHAVPFYAVLGDSDTFSMVPAAIAASTLAALAAMLMYLALYRLVTPRTALVGGLVFAFATPTWSVSADALWSHTLTQAALAGTALAAAKNRWDIAGLALGLGVLARPHIVVVAVVLAAGVSWSRRDLRPALRLAVGPSLGLLTLVLLNAASYGQASVGGAYGSVWARLSAAMQEGLPSQIVDVTGFLVSPGRGLVAITPVLLLAAPLLVRAWRSAPPWTCWLAAGGVAYTATQLLASSFDGGDQFAAYRHGLELLTCLVPLTVMAVALAGRLVQSVALALSAVMAGVTALGALGFAWVPSAEVWRTTDLLRALEREPAVTVAIVVITIAAAATVGLWRWRIPDETGHSAPEAALTADRDHP